jgi:MHS family proline/betaine transporter-like MFS transporter
MSTLSVIPEAYAPVHHPAHDPVVHRRTTLAGLAGNVMEWYDFAIYGYFAPVIGQHFFPAEAPAASLIAAYGVFAAGFLMRPLGGLIFGHIGDRVGRRAALTLSVLAMAIPTFLIGVLPGYAQLGVLASVLLVLLRMVQGLSVGGEYTTSVVFLVEGAPAGQRGRAGSWSVFGAVGGILLGSAVGAALTGLLSEEAVARWGWRLPFLAGLGVGLAGLAVRRHLPEAPAAPARTASPLLEAFRVEWRVMLRLAGLNALNAVGFYLAFVYLVSYLSGVVGLPSAAAFDINTVNMLVLLLTLPLAGALSDRLGRRPVLLAAAGGTLVLAWPLLWLLHHPHVAAALAGQMGLAVLLGLYLGVIPAAMVEATPSRVRCSALSVGYNLCLGVVGGTAPMAAAFLVARLGELSPALYLMAAAAVTFAVVLRLRETAGEPLP